MGWFKVPNRMHNVFRLRQPMQHSTPPPSAAAIPSSPAVSISSAAAALISLLHLSPAAVPSQLRHLLLPSAASLSAHHLLLPSTAAIWRWRWYGRLVPATAVPELPAAAATSRGQEILVLIQRKRVAESNLEGDYKKIKEWESQITREDTTESFWPQPQDEDDHLLNNNNNKEEEEDDEAVFDNGRNSLFSNFAQSAQEEAAGSPEKEFTKTPPAPAPVPIPILGATYGTQQTSSPKVGATTSHEGRKWRRFGADGDEETNTLQCQLIEVLEKNGKILCAQLKAQNTNFQLDREQRKDHTGSLVTVLNKLADALGRIADKL
ncbi:unnamed protein product [Camellia sinensis]